MLPIVSLMHSGLERGLIYALVVAAMYVTSRVIKFDDLSVEGSFGLGGAVTAACVTQDIHPWISLACAIIAGALTGMVTGLLHTKLKLNNLISGIIVSTALFSICLKIGSSTTLLTGHTTLFARIATPLLFLLPMGIGCIAAVAWLLQTQVGFLLQAIGTNPRMLTHLGKNIDGYKITGLMIANSINACAGSLFVHYTGYFSIWANVGILIIALTGLIIAELMSSRCGLNILLGAIAYQFIITMTFELNIDQDWNKLITALLLVALFSLRRVTPTPFFR